MFRKANKVEEITEAVKQRVSQESHSVIQQKCAVLTQMLCFLQ